IRAHVYDHVAGVETILRDPVFIEVDDVDDDVVIIIPVAYSKGMEQLLEQLHRAGRMFLRGTAGDELAFEIPDAQEVAAVLQQTPVKQPADHRQESAQEQDRTLQNRHVAFDLPNRPSWPKSHRYASLRKM